MNLHAQIAKWIEKQVKAAGAKGCVVGLSGGVDSATVAALCKKAFPKTTLALIMPCFSNPLDRQHALLVAQKFGIETKEIELTPALQALYRCLEGKECLPDYKDLASANLRPRLRMSALYYFANKLNYLVVGTGNKSEVVMGYFTKYGDGGVDIEPLGGLLKKEVRELAKKLGVPKEVLNKPPSAGLWHGQTDEGEMGITYGELDKIIEAIESGKEKKCNPKLLAKVKKRMRQSRHKFSAPPVFKAKEI
ncbi:MAG: NAD(+) synthase [Candidatus Margulisiibacteriota bacterium]